MHRLYKCVVSALIILIASCSSEHHLSALDDTATIVALGDSLTHGTGASSNNSYPDHLSQSIRQTVINAGIPGDKTKDVLNRLTKVLETHNPDLVIVCIGGNDFLRKVNKAKIVQNLKTIVTTIRENNSQVMLVAVPEPGLFLGDSEIYQQVSEDLQVPLLEDVLSDYLSDDNFKSDAIHLNDQGYQQLARDIQHFLSERGAIR